MNEDDILQKLEKVSVDKEPKKKKAPAKKKPKPKAKLSIKDIHAINGALNELNQIQSELDSLKNDPKIVHPANITQYDHSLLDYAEMVDKVNDYLVKEVIKSLKESQKELKDFLKDNYGYSYKHGDTFRRPNEFTLTPKKRKSVIPDIQKIIDDNKNDIWKQYPPITIEAPEWSPTIGPTCTSTTIGDNAITPEILYESLKKD